MFHVHHLYYNGVGRIRAFKIISKTHIPQLYKIFEE